MIEKIIAPIDATRMSDFMTILPNGILNKKLTGVGGTYLCLTNYQPYIVVSPTVELIQNKCFQHKEVLGLHGSFTYSEVQHYLKDNYGGKVSKIMVTYDGLPKLVNMLSITCSPYEDYSILIDEYHEVLGSYSFRDSAILGVLEESLKFKNKCFLSATPINPTYCPSILKELPAFEIEWAFTKKIIPTRIKTTKPYMSAVNIIKQYKAGGYCMEWEIKGEKVKSYEAYFFINSVRAIKDMIDNAGLVDKEYKIICADNKDNIAKLDGYTISKVSDPNKPFTFVTSKSFVGTDFYSETGVTFVISNVANSNTLLDVATSIFQISGRIRNEDNPFKNNIVHIYNTGASELTRKDFDKVVENKLQETKLQIEGFDRMLPEQREAFRERVKDDKNTDYTYFNEKTRILEINELKMLNERFEFEIVHETYTNGITLREAYRKNNFDVSEDQQYEQLSEKFITNLSSIQFKEILKEYCDLIDLRNNNNENVSEERIQYLENLNETIKEIINVLGTGRVRNLKFSKTAINKHLKDSSYESQNKIKDKLNNIFKKNIIYTSADVKQKTQEVYNKLSINKKANATDLAKYFLIDKKNRKINGKVQDSIIILN